MYPVTAAFNCSYVVQTEHTAALFTLRAVPERFGERVSSGAAV